MECVSIRAGLTKERVIVPRRFAAGNAPPPAKDGPRVNEEIFSRTILLIGDDGHKYGEIGLDEGRAIAEEKSFDLVEVSPPYDNGELTSLLAANLLYELLCVM